MNVEEMNSAVTLIAEAIVKLAKPAIMGIVNERVAELREHDLLLDKSAVQDAAYTVAHNVFSERLREIEMLLAERQHRIQSMEVNVADHELDIGKLLERIQSLEQLEERMSDVMTRLNVHKAKIHQLDERQEQGGMSRHEVDVLIGYSEARRDQRVSDYLDTNGYVTQSDIDDAIDEKVDKAIDQMELAAPDDIPSDGDIRVLVNDEIDGADWERILRDNLDWDRMKEYIHDNIDIEGKVRDYVSGARIVTDM